MCPGSSLLTSEESLDAFLRAFESGTFPAADFHHQEHLIVAACYLLEADDEDAAARTRTNIRRYNESQGGKNTEDAGYHETLTIFWLRLIRAHLPLGLNRLTAVQTVVGQFATNRDLFGEYYSFDVVKSRDARLSWVAPDLKDLP